MVAGPCSRSGSINSSPTGVIAARVVLLTGERVKNTPFSLHLWTMDPLDMPADRFLYMLRFENREKLDDLGIKIVTNTLKSGD